MTTPHLAVRNSGYGGRGYADIFSTEEKPQPVPGVTTALGALDKPGIASWQVQQTAAYASVNAQKLLDRTEEQAYRMLAFYPQRMTSAKFDDPEIDIYNYHEGVLHDLGELGTDTHVWCEAYMRGWERPELNRPEQAQMCQAFVDWFHANKVEVAGTEVTLYGENYAGTADLLAKINGTHLCVDLKTSRAIRDEHFAQLGALGAAHTMAVPCLPGETDAVEYKGEWYRPEPLHPIQGYAVLHMRPDEYDKDDNFVPAYCELVIIPNEVIDAGFELFKAALAARHGQRSLKEARKKVGFNA